jgi:hypothetical protein
MLKNHSPSATACSPGILTGKSESAMARIPVPIVAANQFGVNCRTTSRGLDNRESGFNPVTMACMCSSIGIRPYGDSGPPASYLLRKGRGPRVDTRVIAPLL